MNHQKENRQIVFGMIAPTSMIVPFLGVLLLLNGCSYQPEEKPPFRPVNTLDDIQGKWKVIEVTDPNGNGYEVKDIEVTIQGGQSISQDRPLRLEFNADGTYMKMFRTIDGVEKQVGEVSVEITTQATPTQMVWMDRANSKQVTLLERQP